MMMHRDNVHDMSDMRVMGMQQQQTNLNRLDMNNQRMRMNNRQQMQQYRLDNDLNQMQVRQIIPLQWNPAHSHSR